MADDTVVEATPEASAEEQPSGNGNGSAAPDQVQIVPRPDRTPLSQRDPVSIAKHFAASGYFADAEEMSQAVVKIVAGEELGFGPMTAMAGIHIIEGKPSLSANLIATCVKRPALPLGGRNPYSYRILTPMEKRAEECEIAFFELEPGGGKEEIGRSKFTIAMANRAGLIRARSGWEKYPEALLFARTLTQGVRWYCPDVTAGSPAYTPEELGADVNEYGEVVAIPAPAPSSEAHEEAPSGPDAERIEQLERGIELVDVEFSRLCVLFGSVGAEAPKINRGDSLRVALRQLTPEQADKLDKLLHREADREVTS